MSAESLQKVLQADLRELSRGRAPADVLYALACVYADEATRLAVSDPDCSDDLEQIAARLFGIAANCRGQEAA